MIFMTQRILHPDAPAQDMNQGFHHQPETNQRDEHSTYNRQDRSPAAANLEFPGKVYGPNSWRDGIKSPIS
jgi:hypothetical protein